MTPHNLVYLERYHTSLSVVRTHPLLYLKMTILINLLWSTITFSTALEAQFAQNRLRKMSQDSHMCELVSDVGVVLIWTFSVHRLGACKHDVPAGLTEILHNGTPEHVLVQYNKTESLHWRQWCTCWKAEDLKTRLQTKVFSCRSETKLRHLRSVLFLKSVLYSVFELQSY